MKASGLSLWMLGTANSLSCLFTRAGACTPENFNASLQKVFIGIHAHYGQVESVV